MVTATTPSQVRAALCSQISHSRKTDPENYKSMKYVSSKIGKITNSKVVFLDEKPEGYSLPFMSLSKLDKIINYVHIIIIMNF